MADTLKCPKCGGEWFRKKVLRAVVLVNEPRPDRLTPYREQTTVRQYAYTCNECGYELT